MKNDFPTENVNDLINTIGQGNIITSLDIFIGYWIFLWKKVVATLRHSKHIDLNIGGR